MWRCFAPTKFCTQQNFSPNKTKLQETQISSHNQTSKKWVYFFLHLWLGENNIFFCCDTEMLPQLWEYSSGRIFLCICYWAQKHLLLFKHEISSHILTNALSIHVLSLSNQQRALFSPRTSQFCLGGVFVVFSLGFLLGDALSSSLIFGAWLQNFLEEKKSKANVFSPNNECKKNTRSFLFSLMIGWYFLSFFQLFLLGAKLLWRRKKLQAKKTQEKRQPKQQQKWVPPKTKNTRKNLTCWVVWLILLCWLLWSEQYFLWTKQELIFLVTQKKRFVFLCVCCVFLTLTMWWYFFSNKAFFAQSAKCKKLKWLPKTKKKKKKKTKNICFWFDFGMPHILLVWFQVLGQNVRIFCNPETAKHRDTYMTRCASISQTTTMGRHREVHGSLERRNNHPTFCHIDRKQSFWWALASGCVSWLESSAKGACPLDWFLFCGLFFICGAGRGGSF